MQNIYSAENVVATHDSSFLAKVMAYTTFAILLTAVGVFSFPYIFTETMPPIQLLIILELILVFTHRKWAQWPRPVNILVYAFYAFFSGITLAPIVFMALSLGGTVIIIKALVVTACLSLAAGIYALTTSRDLSGMGGFLVMALIGLILVGILNIFFPSTAVEFYSALAGVGLFSAFIAYDIQMIQKYPKHMAIEASIGLYLSIVNLFIDVLRVLMALSRD
jgi:FtsH-binding integral membrane protein